MKKLMIAAAIVCVAAVSQAAQVAWGNTSTSKITDLTGTALTGGASGTALAAGLTVFLVDAAGEKVASTTTISTMTAGLLDSKYTNWTCTYGTGEGKYDQGDLFSIIAEATFGGQKYEMTITEGFALTAGDNSGSDTIPWTAGSYGKVDGGVATWQAVAAPEPTSGLLLLLGVAGMALKRRRA